MIISSASLANLMNPHRLISDLMYVYLLYLQQTGMVWEDVEMNARFTQWGNSLAVRIPKDIARQLGAFDGKPADLEVRGGSLVITPLEVVPVYDINELVAGITPENLHAEIDAGGPIGNEFP